MKKGTAILIGVGAVAVLGYAVLPMLQNAINPGGGGSPEDGNLDLTNNPPEGSELPIILAQNYEAPKESLTDKVKRLQKLIGVTADGKVGPQTMAKLNKFVSVTTLSSANIDGVLKTLNYVVPAVNSLISNRTSTPARKKEMWDYWVSFVKKGNITFDPYINRAYGNVTGRSLYQDYANRALKGIDLGLMGTGLI